VTLHTIIFIGRSGCGKGTQADLLKERITRQDKKERKIMYVETGDHFRSFIRDQKYSSKLSKEVYEKDERQPNFLACWMWSNLLIEELEPEMHLIFDGAPRSLSEAQILDSALKFYKREKPTVIYIDVSRRWSETHLLKRGRSDDVNIAKIDKRLDWFDKDVIPAIDFLRDNPGFRFIEVNGEQSIEKVQTDIIEAYDYNS
jgi:adenylate kinase family enzyme